MTTCKYLRILYSDAIALIKCYNIIIIPSVQIKTILESSVLLTADVMSLLGMEEESEKFH